MKRTIMLATLLVSVAAGCAAGQSSPPTTLSAVSDSPTTMITEATTAAPTTTTMATTTTAAPDATTTSAAVERSTAERPGRFVRTVDRNGVERSYVLYVPRELTSGDGGAPLVIDLHGFTSNPTSHDAVSGMQATAAAEGFVVVQPAARGRIPVWDATADDEAGADDIGFMRAIVDAVDDEVSIDRNRVFATGFSNGGGMAHRLACDAADLVAAIGTVSGAYVDWTDCAPSQPVAVISFHGTSDFVVPYEGVGAVFATIPEWATEWAERNGCGVGPIRQDLFADVYADAWSQCDDGADVVLFTISRGLHAWPGSADGGLFVGSESISATTAFWEFFSGHGR